MIKREKRRYLALQVAGEQPIDERAVLDAVQASVIRLFGEYGASKTNLKPITCIPEKRQVVVCCSHTMLEEVRAAVAAIMEVNGETAALHVVGVSGTLKALSKKT
jgi:ribonuclease P/MRP protein subunit POP5